MPDLPVNNDASDQVAAVYAGSDAVDAMYVGVDQVF